MKIYLVYLFIWILLGSFTGNIFWAIGHKKNLHTPRELCKWYNYALGLLMFTFFWPYVIVRKMVGYYKRKHWNEEKVSSKNFCKIITLMSKMTLQDLRQLEDYTRSVYENEVFKQQES